MYQRLILLQMNTEIHIEIYSPQDNLLLSTKKTRYESLPSIVEHLASKVVQANVVSLSVTKPGNNLYFKYVIRESTSDAARTFIYGEEFARE